ncbi:hypothetical protein [Propionicicella superfundia]|uniref:hypothetical protein n=1 Tax=Propionicicella superfundia TaxID=348582 RepID=UPI00040628EA|nr:hypothetical protein [Propionicicella superfundia]
MTKISIDLDAMAALVAALDAAARDAPAAASRIRSDLDYVWLSYPGLSRWRAGGQAIWAIESIAESCRRRLNKAWELYQSDPGMGRVVSVDEDQLVTEDAQQAAALIGNIDYDQLDDIPQELLDLLKRNQGDPDFARQFAVGLDPLAAAMLLTLINNHVAPGSPAQDPAYMARYRELLDGLGATLSLGAASMDATGQAQFNKKWADSFAEPTAGTPLALIVSRGTWSDDFLSAVKASIDKVENDFVSSWSYRLFRGGDPRVDAWLGHAAPIMIDPEADPDTGDHPQISDPMYGLFRAAVNNPQWILDNFSGGPLTDPFDYDSANQTDQKGQIDLRAKQLFDRQPDQATMTWFIQSVLTAEAASIQNGGTSGLLADVQKQIGVYTRLERIENAKGFWDKWGHAIIDVVSLVPFVGEVADGVNAVWYYAEGDVVNGSLSVANVFLPSVVGGVVHAGKWLKKGMDVTEVAKLLVTSSRVADMLNPRIAHRIATVVPDLPRSAAFGGALDARDAAVIKRAEAIADRDAIIDQLDQLGITVNDLSSEKKIDAEINRLAHASSHASPQAKTLIDELMSACATERKTYADQRTASEALGDKAARDVLGAQGAVPIPELAAARGKDTFDVAGLSGDGRRLVVAEAKGGAADLSKHGRKLPDGTRAAQGSPAYFHDVWAADTDFQKWLGTRPDVVRGIRNGTIEVDYQLVHAAADGKITVTTLASTACSRWTSAETARTVWSQARPARGSRSSCRPSSRRCRA